MKQPPQWARHPFRLAFLSAMIVVIPLAVFLAGRQVGLANADTRLRASDQRLTSTIHRLEDEIVARQVNDCKARNANRRALQIVLDEVAAPSDTDNIDFSAVPAWNDLTAELQVYLTALEQQLDQAGADNARLRTIAAAYRRSNPQSDCDKLARDVRKEITGD